MGNAGLTIQLWDFCFDSRQERPTYFPGEITISNKEFRLIGNRFLKISEATATWAKNACAHICVELDIQEAPNRFDNS